jgi:2-oxoglutarate ferredoxin oxidoreductase subunit beta
MTSLGTLTAKDFKSDLKPIWCPGCGDFGVVQAICRALAAIGRPPHEIAFVSGIGCSSHIPGYTSAYGFNSLHGRALPIAQGIKIANPGLLVLAAGGDGDGFSIGGGHVPHAIRRNVDIAYIVMDNQIYGLTNGQLSPTSPRGRKTVSSADGSLESPVNPLAYVLGYGAPFVAQGTPADLPALASVIEQAIQYPGFAFVNVQCPCVTYGDEDHQIKALKARMRPLGSIAHDPTDLVEAFRLAQTYGTELYTGVLYRNPDPLPTYDLLVRARQRRMGEGAARREKILDMFVQK